MSFSDMVKQNLATSFEILADLKKLAVFSHRTSSGFNFGTGQPVNPVQTTVEILGVQQSARKGEDRYVKSFIFMTDDAPDIAEFDTVTIDGQAWSVSLPIEKNEYITTVYLAKIAP